MRGRVRNLALAAALPLAGCVSPSEWQAVREQAADLRVQFLRNEREGWTKEQREEFRRRLDRTSEDIAKSKPTDMERLGSYAGWVAVGAMAFARGAWPVIAAALGYVVSKLRETKGG